MSANKYKIGVVGLWHLGEIYASGLAQLGHIVIGIDENKEVVEDLSKAVPPLAEPELENLLHANIEAGRLSFTDDMKCVKDCNVLWIAFDTPVNEKDEVDMSGIYSAVKKITPHLQHDVLIVVSSQLPAGSSKKIKEIISKLRSDLRFDYVYTPENLRLGEAVKCFAEPGRIVVGADSQSAKDKLKDIFSGMKTEFLCMSVASAEMTKHALNAFLATSLSFIYDISDVCEAVGADVTEVASALRADSRIGKPAYLDSSVGFSGGTLGRDLKALIKIAKNNSLPLPVISSVFKKNEKRLDKVTMILKKEMKKIKGGKVALFGLTYKAGTSTLRRSQALMVAQKLKKVGIKLRLHDPEAKRVDIENDPYKAAQGVGSIVLLTPWPQFKKLDFKKLKEVMTEPFIFFDSRNFLKDQEGDINSVGLKYKGIGR